MAKDDKKQKLIKARSISTITTKEITKEAGVSVGVFYNYFESKEDVFRELIENFFNYSLEQIECLKNLITGNNLRSEIKFKEFLINGLDKNWENHFLNSDILLLSRKDEEFKKTMMSFNERMVSIIAEILMVINPEISETTRTMNARFIMNLIQNSYPVFTKFEGEREKEEYVEMIVGIIFDISFK